MFQNVGSREWIFLEIRGLGNENLEKIGSRELNFLAKTWLKMQKFSKN